MRSVPLALLLCGLGGFGCAHPAPPSLLSREITTELRLPHRPSAPGADARRRVLERARALLDGAPWTADGLQFDPDPVGFVRAAFWAAEIDLVDPTVATDPAAHGLELLYRSAARRGRLHRELPGPGDLIFWDATPRGNALYPGQVAIVEQVGEDGTVVALGLFAAGPARVHMNLRQPDATLAANGTRLNHQSSGPTSATLAQLFRSFADPFGG